MTAVNVLFTRIAKEIEAKNPSNPIHFIVDFLCKNYAEHLHGFASIWNSDPELEAERQEVVHFFKHHKISTQVGWNWKISVGRVADRRVASVTSTGFLLCFSHDSDFGQNQSLC